MTEGGYENVIKTKHLRNADYFAIIASCSLSTLLTNYATNGLVAAPQIQMKRMQQLQLCVHVVDKTSHLEI